MNSSVVFRSQRAFSPVVCFRTFRPVQKIRRKKMGYAVFPARIMRPMVMRTRWAFSKGIMFASSSDMPELLKAETPLKMPAHQGLMPLPVAVAG